MVGQQQGEGASDPGASAGADHEATLAAAGLRKPAGAYYTPPDVVDRLLDLVLEPLLIERAAVGGAEAVASVRVLDPSCGSGNFLVSAAERIAGHLVGSGVAAAEAAIVARHDCVAGVDVDPVAVELCRAALGVAAADRIVRADALAWPAGGSDGWAGFRARVGAGVGFDLVVGNPPFLGQLASATARTPTTTVALRERFGPALAAFTDPAALFLVLALEQARPDGGLVALLQPRSVLAARDAAAVRRRVLEEAELSHLWVAGQRVFAADVEVVAPVLRRRGAGTVARLDSTREAARDAVRLVLGREFRSGGSAPSPSADDDSWSSLLAAARGVPLRRLRTSGLLGDLAQASADFRDQYYGLAPHLVDRAHAEDSELAPLVTAGAIDPAHVAWGERSTRFQKVDRRHPRVVLADLDEALAAWARRRLVPKVLVAPQTRVIEAVVDAAGRLLPSVPVVTVVPLAVAPAEREAQLWRIAAVLSAPPVVSEAARRHLGAGLSGDVLRLSPRNLLALPLPADDDRWAEGAAEFRLASRARTGEERLGHLTACARAMVSAYLGQADDELLTWWIERLPRRGA